MSPAAFVGSGCDWASARGQRRARDGRSLGEGLSEGAWVQGPRRIHLNHQDSIGKYNKKEKSIMEIKHCQKAF